MRACHAAGGPRRKWSGRTKPDTTNGPPGPCTAATVGPPLATVGKGGTITNCGKGGTNCGSRTWSGGTIGGVGFGPRRMYNLHVKNRRNLQVTLKKQL